MSIVEFNPQSSEMLPLDKGAPFHVGRRQPFHRIREVRIQQGMSIRSVARRMGAEPRTLRQEEDPYTDVPLSRLHEWQRVLDVPISDLLVECETPLSRPVMERARLVKLMKTAAALRHQAESEPMRRMSQMLIEQILEIMPELAEVNPWHNVGQRRTLDESARILERIYSHRLHYEV